VANRKCEHDRRHSTCSICSPESVYKMYAYKAEKRGLRFELTLDQFIEIVQRRCVFCGECVEPRGVDRRNNSRGYVFDNCQPCCGPCNALKGVRDQQTWLAGILKIAKYQEALQKQKALKPPAPLQTTPEPKEELTAPSDAEILEQGHTKLSRQLRPQFRIHDPNVSPEARRYLDGL
jgi:hypothetical protein